MISMRQYSLHPNAYQASVPPVFPTASLVGFRGAFSAASLAAFLGMIMLLFLILGCSAPLDEQGVVARVNGEAVFLSEIEAVHDLKYLAGMTHQVNSLPRLREEYGAVLTEILIQRLVARYLADHGLAVTDEEMEAAEMVVRADYPEGAFEQMLIEEYIHLDRWREQLRAGLNQNKLVQKVLRPSISIDYLEVDAYYRERIADFYLRPRVRFLLVQGQERDLVEKVLELSATEPDPDVLGQRFDRVDVHAYALREDNIPGDWQALLSGLEPKQATSILSRNPDGYQVLVLLERTEGRIVDPAQAYPLVERILLESKLREAFDAWLTEALRSASIQVNHQLLARE
ncbi:peptidylprolyl isomerase [Desulfonatronum sp. SC1]|uniref:peptidylprolyl isomerase n=1 Tax=Desulfonatronum sp. SC1 TaxID=2109626 RepID=UPI000D2F4A8B|nr:peptidylprolyl isomerase [Desulfonatronum sp. SC1]PTN33327.1 parvulin peptidyl-prolyl isomerase [Desulfonatronum sp. SC1]